MAGRTSGGRSADGRQPNDADRRAHVRAPVILWAAADGATASMKEALRRGPMHLQPASPRGRRTVGVRARSFPAPWAARRPCRVTHADCGEGRSVALIDLGTNLLSDDIDPWAGRRVHVPACAVARALRRRFPDRHVPERSLPPDNPGGSNRVRAEARRAIFPAVPGVSGLKPMVSCLAGHTHPRGAAVGEYVDSRTHPTAFCWSVPAPVKSQFLNRPSG